MVDYVLHDPALRLCACAIAIVLTIICAGTIDFLLCVLVGKFIKEGGSTDEDR